MLYLTGIIISFFLVFTLMTKKNKSQADNVLAVWLLFLGLHLLLFYILISGQSDRFPFLLGLEIPLPLVHGPFLFGYVSALTQKDKVKKTFLLHFVPFFMGGFSLISFYLLPAETKVSVYKHQGAGYETLLAILFVAIVLSGISYSLLSLRSLYRHRKNIGEQFSSTEKINLSWLRYLILGSSLVWLTVILGNDGSTFTAIVFYMVFIGYFGIKQVGIFTNNHAESADQQLEVAPITETKEATQPERVKYENSGLSTAQLELIHHNMLRLMQEEKLFSNPELTLTDLATRLEVHPNTLSQVINSMEQRNFFDYINGQRVAAFTQIVLLPENQKFTLLALAFECGFNSKTSFNRNFKKVTGLSPTEYLKQANISLK